MGLNSHFLFYCNTVADGLLIPEDIVRPVVSALTGSMKGIPETHIPYEIRYLCVIYQRRCDTLKVYFSHLASNIEPRNPY